MELQPQPDSETEIPAAAWQNLGPHRFAIELDTLRWSPQGEISEQEGDIISDKMVALAKPRRKLDGFHLEP